MLYNNENENNQAKKQDKRTFFIALFIYAVIVTDIMRLAASITGNTFIESLVETVRNILYIFIFIGYYYYSSRNIKQIGLILAMIYIILLMVSYLLNPQIVSYAITLTMLFISRYLLAFVMISRLENPRVLIQKVVNLSWVIPLYVLLYMVSPKDLSTRFAYSMTFSYNLLLPSVACFYSFYVLNEKRLYSIFICALAVMGMFIYGSRGTVICIGIAIIYILFFYKSKYSSKQFAFRVLLSLLLIGVLMSKDMLLALLTQVLPNSRSLYLLQSSNFLWDSNRNVYFDMAMDFLSKSPLKVTGLAGDTFVYGIKYGLGVELGRHSHNMFLELLVSYGLVIGGIACLIIIYRIVKSFITAKTSKEMMDICAFIIAPMLPYIMISGSLCQSYQYWLILGGVFNICNRKVFFRNN